MKRVKSWLTNRMRYFTLIEVIAVAAIVASVPMNSYQRAKEKAHETNCRNNLIQVGQLLRMYVLENGTFPKAAFYPQDAEKSDDSIRKIIGGPMEMWGCPSLPDVLGQKGLTYIYNDTLGGKSSFNNPEKKWVLIEMTCTDKNAPHPHPGGYNVLFADGHVIATKTLPTKITDAHK